MPRNLLYIAISVCAVTTCGIFRSDVRFVTLVMLWLADFLTIMLVPSLGLWYFMVVLSSLVWWKIGSI